MSTDGSFSVPITTGSSTVCPSGSSSLAVLLASFDGSVARFTVSVMCPPVVQQLREYPGRYLLNVSWQLPDDRPKVAVREAPHHLFGGLVVADGPMVARHL